ncbi:gamma-glutamyltransferase [Oceaniserpentilla sp. 4NH20-0058]|uniref:gamma-glutamyltransferase n=1 Tax=Oceaniserpentilla sp. 4NH20-0058 TaxID=3127660 RepID=UPI0031046CD6
MKGLLTASSLIFVTALLSFTAHASDTVLPKNGAVASAHPLATQAGINILNKGGNAFDAAVATAAVLAVVEPYSAGMGGGGFWLLHDAKQNKNVFVDAREKAPLKAHRDMYLDKDGNIIPKLSINGPMAAGIPGQAAAFAHLAKEYGALPLEESLASAIKIAKRGFAIDHHYIKLANYRQDALNQYPDAAATFLDNGQVPKEGFIIKQPDLANTLTAIAKHGFDGFYKGEVAKKLVNEVQKNGGIWQLADLAKYNIVERGPVVSQYQEQTIISSPPPSSGGIAIGQMLNMLESLQPKLDWKTLSEADQIHLLSEVMRRAYFDRAHYLGDSDFVNVPQRRLLNKAYNQKLASSINMEKATDSKTLGSQVQIYEGFHTTHLSVIDKQGNRVAATLSINLPFGSAYLAKGTGVLLNNEMDDFSSKPGVPNAYGLVGNEANAIAPEKRPLSSMTPSFVESDGQVAILGTPGGSRIITMVFLGMLEHLQGKPVEDWVNKKRFHHQYLPDVIQHEPDTFSQEIKQALQAKGHQLKDVGRTYGNMHAILFNKQSGHVTAASDQRAVGQAKVQK